MKSCTTPPPPRALWRPAATTTKGQRSDQNGTSAEAREEVHGALDGALNAHWLWLGTERGTEKRRERREHGLLTSFSEPHRVGPAREHRLAKRRVGLFEQDPARRGVQGQHAKDSLYLLHGLRRACLFEQDRDVVPDLLDGAVAGRPGGDLWPPAGLSFCCPPPLRLYGVSIRMENGCHQNGSRNGSQNDLHSAARDPAGTVVRRRMNRQVYPGSVRRQPALTRGPPH